MIGTKEICEIIGVKPSTVRKYAGALEAAGYVVHKGDSGHREYTEDDATVFRHLKALCDQSGMTVELAANVVVSRHGRAHESVAPAIVEQENQVIQQYDKRYEGMIESMSRMMEQNEHQAAELERLHKRMDDQNANIAVILREILETRRMVAAANDKKWWQFWRKSLVLPDLSDPETVWRLENRK
ncbi:MerR family transcriptional regulator [Micrococcus luteus]|nr:MerR family transcriptional regulator [Micrococcus luteus]